MSVNFTSYPCSDYLYCIGLDSVTTVIWPASFDLQNVNVLHETMFYVSAFHVDPGSL